MAVGLGSKRKPKTVTASKAKRRKAGEAVQDSAPAEAEPEPAADIPDDVAVELPPEEETDKKAAEEPEKDSDSSSSESDSSDSESSSSSSSESSESESEVEEAVEDEAAASEEEKEDAVAKRHRHMMTLRQAQLKRDELGSILLDMPPEEHDRLVNGAFVSIKIGGGGEDGKPTEGSILCQISGVEPSRPYRIQHAVYKNNFRTLQVQLKCKRGKSERLIKVSQVSNQPIRSEEVEQWEKTMIKLGIDVDLLIETLQERTVEISSSKIIKYDEATVNRILASKPKIEFDAQKQSRKAFEVQCSLTQMDISSIRESEVPELEERYGEAVEGLREMQRIEYGNQSEWFENRRDLFSLKEINRKNLGRQIRDDRHALRFTLDTEAQGDAALNPYERRACLPVAAWDTRLTEVEALKKKKTVLEDEALEGAQEGKKAPEVATSAEAETAATAPGGTAASNPEVDRVASVLQAHRRANLLEQLGSLMAAKAA